MNKTKNAMKHLILFLICFVFSFFALISLSIKAFSDEIYVGSFSVKPSLSIEKVSGDNQNAPEGTTLPEDFVIIIKDGAGNAVQSVLVNFTIISYPYGATGQRLSIDQTRTLSDGKASTRLTLGNISGDYQVKAEIDWGENTNAADIRYWEQYFFATTCTDPDDSDGDGYYCDDCLSGNPIYYNQCCDPNEESLRVVYRKAASGTGCGIPILQSDDFGPGCYSDNNCDGVPDVCATSDHYWEPTGFVCANIPSVSINSPVNQTKFVFSNDDPGILTVPVTSSANNISNYAALNWIFNLYGSSLTTRPDINTWYGGTFIYSGLPASNSYFGNNSVTASISVAGSYSFVADSVDIIIFFYRDSVNNPVGNDPNWYYYWSQTNASVGNHDYSECCPDDNGVCTDDYGFYIPGDNYYFVCTTSNENIDEFAYTCIHENCHQTHYWAWVATGMEDTDGDWIPDSVEDENGNGIVDPGESDPNDMYTFSSIYDDEDMLCYDEEDIWLYGNANQYDWGAPGRQY